MLSDGYDTTSVALAPLFYEVNSILIYYPIFNTIRSKLAKNQEVQNKLREELQTAASDSNQISYENLMELPYLDQVVYESLRLNPPLTFSSRECSEKIEIEGVKGHKVTIEKGLRIFIPILSIHHDAGNVNY